MNWCMTQSPPSLAGIESLMLGLSVIFGIGLEQISFSNGYNKSSDSGTVPATGECCEG